MKEIIPLARPSVGKEELKNIEKIFKTCWLGMGSSVYEFEKKIEAYLGAKYAIAVNTGTTAIHIALSAIGGRPRNSWTKLVSSRDGSTAATGLCR